MVRMAWLARGEAQKSKSSHVHWRSGSLGSWSIPHTAVPEMLRGLGVERWRKSRQKRVALLAALRLPYLLRLPVSVLPHTRSVGGVKVAHVGPQIAVLLRLPVSVLPHTRAVGGVKVGGNFFLPFFLGGPFLLGGVPGCSCFLGTGGQGHGAGDAPRGCGVETRGPGLGSQPGNASTHLYIYTYLCIYIYTHSYI